MPASSTSVPRVDKTIIYPIISQIIDKICNAIFTMCIIMCLIIVFISLGLFNLFNKAGVLQAGRCCIAAAGGSEKTAREMEKENQTAGKDKRAPD
jgi:hypothetical protein